MLTSADAEEIVKEKYGILPISSLSEVAKQEIIKSVNHISEMAAGRKLCPSGLSFSSLLKSSDSMFRFMEICNKYPDLHKHLAVNADGQQVQNKNELLKTGFTSAQGEQFLVFKTAQTQFNKFLPEGMDARKFTLIAPYLAFQWQLPLLSLYENLRDEVISEIGPSLLEIKTRQGMEALLHLKLDEIVQARKLLKERFVEILRINPAGVHNLLNCSTEKYQVLEKILGNNMFVFLCREPELFEEVLRAPTEIIDLFGPQLAYVATHAFRRLNRLPPPRSVCFLTRLIGAYPHALKSFSDSDFVDFTIKNAVESLVIVEGDMPTFEKIVSLKVKAMKDLMTA